MSYYTKSPKCLAIENLIAEYKDTFKVNLTLEDFKTIASELKLRKLQYLIDTYEISVYLNRLTEEVMLYHLYNGFSRILRDIVLSNTHIDYLHTDTSNRDIEFMVNNFNSFRESLYYIIKYCERLDNDLSIDNARNNPQTVIPVYNGLSQNIISSGSLLYVFVNYLDTEKFLEFYSKVLEIIDKEDS